MTGPSTTAAGSAPRLSVGAVDLETQRPSFARIAKVAKALFGAAVADVVAIHEDFVWSSREASLKTVSDDSPIHVAALNDGVYWIEDASADRRWAKHEVVANAPYVRFYAGAPIILSDGTRLGVLCVMDVEPKRRDENLCARLVDLAALVAGECEREFERQDLLRAEERLNLACRLGELHVWEVDYRAKTLEKMGAEDTFFEQPITYQELFDDPFGSTIHREDIPKAQENWRRKMAGERTNPIEVRVPRTDGKTVWALNATKAIPDSDGNVVRMIGVLQNITRRKAAEAEIIKAKEEAEAANRSKSAFLANMSHELRTPLNGVMGIADALRRTPLTSSQQELCDIISASARTLEVLLSDLLDFASIESGKIAIKSEPFDLASSVHAAVAPFQSAASAKGLKVSVEIAAEAEGAWMADSTRIRQILLHLLSNAVKFTAEGSVKLTVDAHARGLQFTVTDTGIGFDAVTRARLFQKFEQADGSITRQYGGTGLGLALSRALADAMGATLDAASEPGRGATFALTLDCERIARDESANAADEDEGRAMRVLVVEDHPTNRKVVDIMLSAFGVDLTFAENGQEAVDAFKSEPFDLVFMDMQMPVMDGLTAIREIRALEDQEHRTRTPIYTLTANALPEHAAASAEAGSDGHVTKPVTSDTLLAVLMAAAKSAEDETQTQAA